MFEDIHKKVRIPKQEINRDGIVLRKKAGRPKAPNMIPVQIKMDKVFHNTVKNFAQKTGVSKSSLITIALKNFMERQEKRYKLVEI